MSFALPRSLNYYSLLMEGISSLVEHESATPTVIGDSLTATTSSNHCLFALACQSITCPSLFEDVHLHGDFFSGLKWKRAILSPAERMTWIGSPLLWISLTCTRSLSSLIQSDLPFSGKDIPSNRRRLGQSKSSKGRRKITESVNASPFASNYWNPFQRCCGCLSTWFKDTLNGLVGKTARVRKLGCRHDNSEDINILQLAKMSICQPELIRCLRANSIDIRLREIHRATH